MKILTKVLLCAIIATSAHTAYAEDMPMDIFQNTKRQVRLEKKAAAAAAMVAQVDSLLKAKSFTFVAERAVTQMSTDPFSTLSSYYSFIVSPTKVDSNLPYYGKLNKAPINVAEGPLTFVSEDFQYEQQGVAKGKEPAYVNMNISVKSVYYKLTLEVFETGTATLNVLLDNGSAASFYGHIEPTKVR